jgi:enterochelin esterase-like enzyme
VLEGRPVLLDRQFDGLEQVEAVADRSDPFLAHARLLGQGATGLDCGTEDRLIGGSRDFVKLLIEHDVPFTYAESPGGHTGAYWSREIATALAVQNTVIRRSLAKAEAAP